LETVRKDTSKSEKLAELIEKGIGTEKELKFAWKKDRQGYIFVKQMAV